MSCSLLKVIKKRGKENAHPLCHYGKFSKNSTISPYFSVELSQFVVAFWDLRRTPGNGG